MTRREQHLRVALRSIPNPEHKKSASYGWKGVAQIQMGELFTLFPSGIDANFPRADLAYIQTRAAGTTVGREFEVALTKASVPVQATTWGGVALLSTGGPLGASVLAEQLLQRLIDQGSTSAAELLRMAEAIDQEDDEQERGEK